MVKLRGTPVSQTESTAIHELTEEVRGLRTDLRVFYTKLFGDETGENAQGRIPRIETTQANHERRIVRIERFTWIGAGAVMILAFAGKAVEFVYHIVGIVRH